MFDLSQEAADSIFNLSNVILIIGGTLVAAASLGIYWSGNAKERYANERASKNEREIAETNEQAAHWAQEMQKAKLETERLKEKLAWRRLSGDQANALAYSIRQLNFPFTLSAMTSDPEALQFANDIQAALAQAGVHIEIQASMWFSPKPVEGVIISGSQEDRVMALAEAFARIGITVQASIQPELEDVGIMIGSKPRPAN